MDIFFFFFCIKSVVHWSTVHMLHYNARHFPCSSEFRLRGGTTKSFLIFFLASHSSASWLEINCNKCQTIKKRLTKFIVDWNACCIRPFVTIDVFYFKTFVLLFQARTRENNFFSTERKQVFLLFSFYCSLSLPLRKTIDDPKIVQWLVDCPLEIIINPFAWLFVLFPNAFTFVREERRLRSRERRKRDFETTRNSEFQLRIFPLVNYGLARKYIYTIKRTNVLLYPLSSRCTRRTGRWGEPGTLPGLDELELGKKAFALPWNCAALW